MRRGGAETAGLMTRHRRRMLRNEWRRNHRLAPRREIGRRPTWVVGQLRDKLRSVRAEMWLRDEEDQ